MAAPARTCATFGADRGICRWDEAARGGKCVACLLELRIRRSLGGHAPHPDRPQFLVNHMSGRISRSLVQGRQVSLAIATAAARGQICHSHCSAYTPPDVTKA